MKKPGFRPVVSDARLEDRLVLSHGHLHPAALFGAFFVPAKGFLGAETIAAVGPPGNPTAQVVSMRSVVSTATIKLVSDAINADYQAAASIQTANAAAATDGPTFRNQSITLLSTNLEQGLKAVTGLLPDGNLLYSQLTDPSTQLSQIIAGLKALNPATVTVDQVSAISNATTILAARDQSLQILAQFIQTGEASRGLVVIGFPAHGASHRHGR